MYLAPHAILLVGMYAPPTPSSPTGSCGLRSSRDFVCAVSSEIIKDLLDSVLLPSFDAITRYHQRRQRLPFTFRTSCRFVCLCVHKLNSDLAGYGSGIGMSLVLCPILTH
eukprot:m.64789 g.64789  ORF g.64789 m.64789 type:complete len:110 (-) comp12027_c0_seq1:203-532(-)